MKKYLFIVSLVGLCFGQRSWETAIFAEDLWKYIVPTSSVNENWKNIFELIPKYYSDNNMKKTGIAGIFAASLELTKERVVSISQKKIFDTLSIKKT